MQHIKGDQEQVVDIRYAEASFRGLAFTKRLIQQNIAVLAHHELAKLHLPVVRCDFCASNVPRWLHVLGKGLDPCLLGRSSILHLTWRAVGMHSA